MIEHINGIIHLVDLLTRQLQKHTRCGGGCHDDCDDSASAVARVGTVCCHRRCLFHPPNSVLIYLLSNYLTLKSHPKCSVTDNWIP
jgi:hypothetical protein